MKRLLSLLVLLVIAGLIHLACDPDLFKSEDEGEDPEVGDIITDKTELAVHVGDTLRCWVNASDPEGGTLQYLWENDGGEFVTTPDRDSVIWRAPLHGGDYNLQVKVSNKSKSVTRGKLIRVNSYEKPVVNIISPVNGSFLIQFNSYALITEAFHDNGISNVRIYVNGVLVGTCKEIQPSLFRLDWTADTPAGLTKLKAIAQARSTAAVNADSIYVSLEGVVPGKQ